MGTRRKLSNSAWFGNKMWFARSLMGFGMGFSSPTSKDYESSNNLTSWFGQWKGNFSTDFRLVMGCPHGWHGFHREVSVNGSLSSLFLAIRWLLLAIKYHRLEYIGYGFTNINFNIYDTFSITRYKS